jgi:hypothetical protein
VHAAASLRARVRVSRTQQRDSQQPRSAAAWWRDGLTHLREEKALRVDAQDEKLLALNHDNALVQHTT